MGHLSASRSPGEVEERAWFVHHGRLRFVTHRVALDTESGAVWFLEVLPELRGDPSLGLVEITQYAGETVFLPVRCVV